MQGATLLQDPDFKQALDKSPFQEGDLPGLSNAIADTFDQLNPEQRQAMRQALDDLDDLPEKELLAFLRLITYIDQNPEEYPKFVDQLLQSGAFEPGDVPDKYDPNFTAIVKALVGQALQKARGSAAEPGFAKGGIVSLKEQAARVKSAGRNGDSILAHISPFEASLLNRVGAGGKVNPKTGLPEFGFWDSVKKVLKVGAQIVGTVVLTPFVGPVAAGAIVGGVSSLLSGGSAKDALKSAVFGGITGGIGAGLSNVFSGAGTFLEGALGGGSLFGGMFGGAGATGAAGAGAGGAEGAAGAGTAGGAVPTPPVRPSQEVIESLAAAQGAPTVPVAAAKKNLVEGTGEFFSKALTPEGMKQIWSDYKVPILLGGGAALIAAGSGGKQTPRPGIVGPTGPSLLASEPGRYGFDVARFAQREAPPSSPVFPPGGYIAPSIAAAPIPPPQYGRVEYPTGIMAAKAGGHISGPGNGTSDSIPARLSDGEFVMTAKAVRGAGNGSRMKGARKMYELMHKYERMA